MSLRICAYMGMGLLAMLAGCGKASPPAPSKPAATVPAAPTPVIDSFRAVWTELGGKAIDPLMWAVPLSASLEFGSGAPAGARQTLEAWLDAHQAGLDKIDALTNQTLEPFEASDVTDAVAWARHPRMIMLNLPRYLMADAAHHFDRKEYQKAVSRLATTLRLCHMLQVPDVSDLRISSIGPFCQACTKFENMAKGGALKGVSGADMRAALGLIDPADPTGQLTHLAADAHRNIAAFKADLSGSDAAEKLAKIFEEHSIFGEPAKTLPADAAARLLVVVPTRSAVDTARGLSTTRIQKVLAEADALVEPAARALQTGDSAAVTRIGNQLLADDTQILKLLLGHAVTIEGLHATAKDAVNAAQNAAQTLAP